MTLVALLVVLTMAGVDLWAWRKAPGQQASDQFISIWRVTPWGRQFYVDFFGLQVVLALWMLVDAGDRGTWLAALLCIVTMPVLGALSAAGYWLLRSF